MAAKIEDPTETVAGQEVTFINVATVERDSEGNIAKGEDGAPVGKDDCFCGCGNEPQGRKAKFMPGHDQRALGMLVRAQRVGRKVVFTPYSETEVLTPNEALPHIFNEKMVEKAAKRLSAIDQEEADKKTKAEEKAAQKAREAEEKAAAAESADEETEES